MTDARDLRENTRALNQNTKAIEALNNTLVAIERTRRATEKPNLCTECETDNCPKGFIRTMLCACCKNRHEPIPENQS